MNRTWRNLLPLLLVITLSFPLMAHHGTAAFDTSKEIVLQGTVTDFIFTNPHVQVIFSVKNGSGETDQWQGELTAPNKLTRAGWNKHTLKQGDSITVTGYQLKTGEKTLWIRKMIGPDGQPMQLFEE